MPNPNEAGTAQTAAPSGAGPQQGKEGQPSNPPASPATKPADGNTNAAAAASKPANDEGAKKLTQEEVNEIVKGRVKDTESKFLKHFGVNEIGEIDKQITEGKQAKQELLLSKNNIAEDRYDDVVTHFKGKGKEITAETLAEAVKTHPEWVKKSEGQTTKPAENTTTAKPLGASQHQASSDEELDRVEKIFGVRPKKVK